MGFVFIFVYCPFRRYFILITILNTKTPQPGFWFPKRVGLFFLYPAE